MSAGCWKRYAGRVSPRVGGDGGQDFRCTEAGCVIVDSNLKPVAGSFQSAHGWPDVVVDGLVGGIEFASRKGLQLLSVNSVLRVTPSVNTSKQTSGALTFWFFFDGGEHAACGPSHMELSGKRLYQLGLTWDHRIRDYYLYVNGVRVANGHRWVCQALDECGPSLHAGSSAFAYGDLAFYNQTLSGEQVKAVFCADGAGICPDEGLQRIHEPDFLPDLKWKRPDT